MANSEPARRKPKFRERNVVKPVPPIAEQAAPVAQALPEPRPTVGAAAVAVAPEQSDEVSSVFPWAAALPRISVEQALYGLIVIVGFVLRIWDVGSRAMHGDESVHAWMAWNLYNGTGYHYDPVYHGPLQFIVTAGLFFLFGVSETTARLMAVLFGTALIFLPYFLRPYMGRVAALLASAYLCFSPAFVYVSRLERDDIFTAFFAFTLAISIFGYVYTRRARYLYIGAASIALSLSAMENTYITVFVFVSFIAIVIASELLAGSGWTGELQSLWASTGTLDLLRPISMLILGAAFLVTFVLCVTTGIYLPVLVVIGVTLVLLVHRQAFLSAQEDHDQPFTQALLGITRRQWLNGITIAFAILFLTFSTFGSNLHGIWDSGQPILNNAAACPSNNYFLNPCRKDIIGGLFYWLSQHQVHRGGQPWFYYTLLFGLYEQIAIILGTIGIVWFLRRPTLFTSFVTYWAILMFAIYSWAGEKFSWLMIHPLLPFVLLTAMFVVDVVRRVPSIKWMVIAVTALLTALELHSMFEVNYVYGADPVEMMVYVQSAPDTPIVARSILALSNKVTNDNTMGVTIDTLETWPFAWYLRNMPNAAYPSYPQILKKPFSTNPVILVDSTHQQSMLPQLNGKYTGHEYTLRWWFPEDYKSLTWASFGQKAIDPSYWNIVAQWLLQRRPFGPKGSVQFYYYVKNGIASPY